METVHIQLPNEGSIVVVLEQLRYQGLGKLIFIKNNEGVTAIRPAYEVRVPRFVEEARILSMIVSY